MFGEYLYNDVFEKAVALYESLAKNHVFYNANKRTVFACMAYYLFERGYVCVLSEKKQLILLLILLVEIVKKNFYRKNR